MIWTVQAIHGSKEWTTLNTSTGRFASTTGVPTRASSNGPRTPFSSLGETFHAVGVII